MKINEWFCVSPVLTLWLLVSDKCSTFDARKKVKFEIFWHACVVESQHKKIAEFAGITFVWH